MVEPADEARTAKLSALQERFSGFETQMEEEARRRRESEEMRSRALRDQMVKVEKTLNSEIKRRVEANKALQTMFEQQISVVQDKLEGVFVEKLDHLQHAVDELSERMAIVERDFATEREKYLRDIDEKHQVVAKDVNYLQSIFEQEKVQRNDRDAQLQKRFAEHELRTDNRFEQEKISRDTKFGTIKDELLRT